jgi:tetratricopeptide (TPR) repeat protein
MEAQELPIAKENESQSKKTFKKKKDHFTKLQAILILVATLIICLVSGYYISEKYLWPNADQQRLIDQLNYYQGLVNSKPNDPQNRVNLGYTYFVKGDNDNAIKQLNIAKDLDKNNFSAYFNLGLVYLDEKRYNDALNAAQKTVELSPKDFKSHLLAGMAYRNLKMYSDALKSLQEALSIMPTNTDVITEIGRVQEDQGKYSEAEKLYKEALSYDPLCKSASQGLERVTSKTKNISKDNNGK